MDENELCAGAIARSLTEIRRRGPLIQNITNLVVTNSTANALLAVGASPAMVEGAEEVAEFVEKSAALVINLGTISAQRAAAMRVAAAAAHRFGTPWVTDPVAVGVLAFRTALARDLLEFRPTAIRGNASEIMALAGAAAGGKGADSAASSDNALAAARVLAREAAAVFAVTGRVDYITDGVRVVAGWNGHPMMTRVTGLGCTATAIVGACLVVEADRLVAVAHALALIGVAGEVAAERARGPGSLQLEILDALYLMDEATLDRRVKLQSQTEEYAREPR